MRETKIAFTTLVFSRQTLASEKKKEENIIHKWKLAEKNLGRDMERIVFTSAFLASPSLLTRTSRLLSYSHHGLPSRRLFHAEASALKSTFSGFKTDDNDVLKMFIKERQENGDFISRVSDKLWWRDSIKFVNSEDESVTDELPEEVLDDRNSGGFLKLVKTQEWIAGDSIAPVNRKLTRKERQNDSEKRRKLNFLKYEALKKELLLLTVGIGISCSGYCLLTLSLRAAVSYAVGVLLSCLYLQLLYYHADNLSKEAVPSIFLMKRTAKIGIRSEDLEKLLERTVKGSGVALSSPRLVFPAIVYGFWALSHQFLDGIFDFQLVPAMFGLFAYKAAALVQVYRDNEDLRFVFPDND